MTTTKKKTKKKKLKNGWGGVRPNSGRKAPEPTKVMRIPLSKIPDVLKLIGKLPEDVAA